MRRKYRLGADDDDAGVGGALVDERDFGGVGEGEELARKHVARLFAVEIAADMVLPKVLAAGRQYRILDFAGAAGGAVAGDYRKEPAPAALGRNHPVELGERIVHVHARGVEIVFGDGGGHGVRAWRG